MAKKLLLLEDESSISEFVEITLIKAGYTVLTAARGADAIRIIDGDPAIDIAILDVMLPDISGFDVCKHIRSHGRRTGVIMLTARSQEADRITGLMLGADDYVVKPFSPSELVLRVDALYRRVNPASEEPGETLVSGEFKLDERARLLTKKDEPVELTQVEYQLVKFFLENEGKALSREDILHTVWGESYRGEVKIVDVNVRRLRIKLEDNPAAPAHLQTVWGYGYKWQA
ncbi:MAG: response regulator transcription factor [Clostridia bacterium]|nr:response regulator transcription factor [Clostridia bacterium]